MRKKVQVALLHQNESKQILLLLLKLIPERGSHWQNVTGHVDGTEQLNSAALRELKEETGILISPEQLYETSFKLHFRDRYQQDCEEYGFYAWASSKQFSYDIQIDKSEHTEFKWIRLSQAKENDFGYSSSWSFIILIKNQLKNQLKKQSLLFTLILSIFLMLPNKAVWARKPGYQLRLHKEEKNDIMTAVTSGHKFYILAKNQSVYDLLKNTTHKTIKSIVVSVFNQPTLGGQRYLRTHNKVRYIVSPHSLRHVERDIIMSPQELEFQRPTKDKPKLYIGAPHETKVP